MDRLHGDGLRRRPKLHLAAFDQVNNGGDELAFALREFRNDLDEIYKCDVWFHDFLLAMLISMDCKVHAMGSQDQEIRMASPKALKNQG